MSAEEQIELASKYLPAYLLTLVNAIGFSILLPVLPFVVERYGGSDIVYGLLLSAYSAFQFIGAPWLGRMSDSAGRRPVLLITQGGTLVSWIIFGLAWFVPEVSFGWTGLPLLVIAFARMLDGITGGNVSVTQAYVADISTHDEKSYIFANVGGIIGLGMIIGPGIGGLLASTELNYLAVALGAGSISFVTLLSIRFGLSESLPPEERKPSEPQPLSQSIRLIDRINRIDPPLIIKQIFIVRALYSAMMALYVSTIALYIIDLFDFTEKTLGMFMFVVGIFIVFNQAVLAKWFIKKLGEVKTLRLGLVMTTAGLFCITLTNDLYLYILFYYVLNLGISLVLPTCHSLTAQYAPPDKVGELMGIGQSFVSLSNAILPVFAAGLYVVLGESFYYLAAALPALALFPALRMVVPQKP